MQRRVSDLSEGVGETRADIVATNLKIDTIGSTQKSTLDVLGQLSKQIKSLSPSLASRASGARCEAVASASDSAERDVVDKFSPAKFEAKWHRILNLPSRATFNSDIHVAFFCWLHLDPEHSKLDFSAIANDDCWSWSDYWAVASNVQTLSLWRRRFANQYMRVPDGLKAAQSIEEVGRVLYLSFVSHRHAEGEAFSAEQSIDDEDVRVAKLTTVWPPSP